VRLKLKFVVKERFLFDSLFCRLYDRTKFCLTETCLAFIVFFDDFSPSLVVSFTVVLFLKYFHWLSENWVDYMRQISFIEGKNRWNKVLLNW
jgi:hypothetical protein